MNRHLKTGNILRLYIVVSLVAAALLSSSLHVVLPLALLAFNLYIWWRGSTVLDLATAYSFVFIIPLLFVAVLGPNFPALFSLPLLAYVDILLRKWASRYVLPGAIATSRHSKLSVILLITTGSAGLLAVLLGNWTLGYAMIASLLYLSIVSALIVYSVPRKPLEVSKKVFRVIAGNQATGTIEILNLTKLGGYLYLDSPNLWVNVKPTTLSLDRPLVKVTFSMVPPLAGPTIPELGGLVIDKWGLSQTKVRLEPIQVNVIPKARYAAWLAKKYLETARPGRVISHTPSGRLGGVHGARKGGEFYAERPYRAGDNLKVIDWKHSIKLGELIVQEFVEPFTSSPLLIVNLAVSDAEEADKLAFSIITAAITLAKAGIPTGIAAYDESKVVLVTDVLSPIELVQKALALTQSINLYLAPTKFLKLVDLYELKVNHDRFKATLFDSEKKLKQLLSLEYAALKTVAELNPASKATIGGLARAKQIRQLVIISTLNHDIEALLFLADNASSRGLKTLLLEVCSSLLPWQMTNYIPLINQRKIEKKAPPVSTLKKN